jgi:hypothetical protein
MAKSEIRAMHVWQAVENLVCQRAGRREHDFAISIAFGETGEVECWRLALSLHLVFQLLEEGPVGVPRDDFLRAAFHQAKLVETGCAEAHSTVKLVGPSTASLGWLGTITRPHP